MRTMIIGGGFVGTTTAVRSAEVGHEVRLVEADPERLRVLRSGRPPFYETGLEEAYARQHAAGKIEVTDHMGPGGPVDLVVVCVGTPRHVSGDADLTQLRSAAHDIGAALRQWDNMLPLDPDAPPLIAVKSTVPPGTTRDVLAPAVQEAAGPDVPFDIAMTPEFLREGNALADARDPDRIVVGADDTDAYRTVEALYGHVSCPVVRTSVEGAEAVKYMANAFLATKIGLANEMGNLSERLGLDIDALMQGVGLDRRIGPLFLDAGCGFGGSCFPKDVAALSALARREGAPSRILDAVLEVNDRQPLRVVERASRLLGGLAGKKVALLGLAFKPGTSDARESRAIPIHAAVLDAGAEVVCHDPVAGREFRRETARPVELALEPEGALKGADIAIIQTAWPDYVRLDPAQVVALMRTPLVLDARRALDRRRMEAGGVQYHALGVGTPVHRRPKRTAASSRSRRTRRRAPVIVGRRRSPS